MGENVELSIINHSGILYNDYINLLCKYGHDRTIQIWLNYTCLRKAK